MPISEAARRSIADVLTLEEISWAGRLEEDKFLARLFDLSTLPSYDGRYKSAGGDIWKHRVMNRDWEDSWVFEDSRFKLLTGPDETFLRFLCETVHPIVRPDEAEATRVVELYNAHLAAEGWEIVEATRIGGKPVYEARLRIAGVAPPVDAARSLADALNADYIARQVTRMQAAINTDPELAIGTAKELVETVCKTILREKAITPDRDWTVSQLVKNTAKELGLARESIPDSARAADTIRRILSNLSTVADGLAELRNAYGTGHGKDAAHRGLQPRHARLAVGAASTLAVFLFETHQEQASAASRGPDDSATARDA